MDFGVEISKILLRIWNQHSQDTIPVFRQDGQNEFWGQNFKNLSPVSESSPLRYHLFQFLGKTDSFDFFCANSPKNVFRMKNSEN